MVHSPSAQSTRPFPFLPRPSLLAREVRGSGFLVLFDPHRSMTLWRGQRVVIICATNTSHCMTSVVPPSKFPGATNLGHNGLLCCLYLMQRAPDKQWRQGGTVCSARHRKTRGVGESGGARWGNTTLFQFNWRELLAGSKHGLMPSLNLPCKTYF